MSWMILQITQIIQPQASNLEFSNMYVSGIEKSRVEDFGCKIPDPKDCKTFQPWSFHSQDSAPNVSTFFWKLDFFQSLNHVDFYLKPTFLIKSGYYIVPSPSPPLVSTLSGWTVWGWRVHGWWVQNWGWKNQGCNILLLDSQMYLAGLETLIRSPLRLWKGCKNVANNSRSFPQWLPIITLTHLWARRRQSRIHQKL